MLKNKPKNTDSWDFPGGPMVETSCLYQRVLSLIRELRSHMLCGMAKINKTTTTTKNPLLIPKA